MTTIYPADPCAPPIHNTHTAIPAGWQLVTEPDALGYGRLIVDGKHFGLPMAVINWIKNRGIECKTASVS